MKPLCAFALCVLSSIALPALAQNAVANGDFDTDLSGWTLGGASGAFPNPADGSPALGSAQLGTASNVVDDLLTQCVDLTTGLASTLSFDFGGRFKNVQFASASIRVDFFTNASCGGGSTGSSTAGNPVAATNGFTEVKNLGVVRPASTGSAKVTLDLHDTSSNPDNGAVARFDHIFFGPPGTTPVELTSFRAD